MKKLFLILSLIGMAVSAQAITLFPYFVDVAGMYQDGPVAEMLDEDFNLPCMYSSKPSGFKSAESAKSFLMDVLPFSTEEILMEDFDRPSGKGTVIMSMMEDGVVSTILLIERPEKGFFVCYDESKLNGN